MPDSGYMSYEEYQKRMTSYEATVERYGHFLHQLPPTHPVKLHLRSLIQCLKSIPEPVLVAYLEQRQLAQGKPVARNQFSEYKPT